MVTVSFEEVVCRVQAKTSRRYRLVLFASEDRQGELRSAYRRGADVLGWIPPFENSVTFRSSTAPLHVSLRLREKGWPGMAGRNVSSYILILDHNHSSRTFELQATESEIQPAPQLSVTVTVAGLAANYLKPVDQTHQDLDDGHPPVGPRTSKQRLSLGLNQRSPAVTSISLPAPIEPPAPHLPLSSSPSTTPPVPVFHVSSPDDAEKETSSTLGGLEQSWHRRLDANQDPGHSKSTSPMDSSQLLSAESAARKAQTEQSSIRLQSNSSTDSISSEAPVASAAGGLGDASYTGVSRLDAVVQIIDVAADIHPLVKAAWSLLNVAYTLAKQQSDLDIKVGDLVKALDANCELARVLTEDQIAGIAETIVAKILREVLNGAAVIKEYCAVRTSKMSAFKFAGSTTAIRVDACIQTLEVFRRDLSDHVVANVHRDLHGLQTLALTLEVDLKAVKAQMDQVSNYVQHQEDDALLNQMPFAPEADRAMRSDERGCLPGTRAEIIEHIVHWAIGADVGSSQAYIRGLNPDSRVLWLCGVAGSGKSSIAISVARVLRSMDRLGAIYGFESAFQTSLNPTNLFSTIARQRAERQPGRKRHLLATLEAMNLDQRATVSASEQFKLFLSVPMTIDPTVLDDVIVIDAFHESGPVTKRAAALLALSPDTPDSVFPSDVRFIITSRYDPDIAERLEGALKCDLPKISVLQMADIRASDTVRDIEMYVLHMLGGMRGLEASRAAGDLARLAVKAEHSFQWASSASRYIVDAEDHDGARLPAERLREILDTRGGLDKLYLSILDQPFRLSITNKESDGTRSLGMILGCLVCAAEPLTVQTIAALASADPSFPAADETDFHILARKLSSIVTGTQDHTTPLVAFHTSFTDFLADEKRSGSYAVNVADLHRHLAVASLAVMQRSLRFNICDLKTSFQRNDEVPDLPERIEKHISGELSYACRFWPLHVAAALSSTSTNVTALRVSFSAFLENKLLLLEWLEVMSLTRTNAYRSLSPLLSLQTENRDLADLILFTAYFSIPISSSVPHIYLSALAFAPTTSLITAPISTHFPNLVHYDPPLLSWPQVRHTLMHQSEVNSVAFSPNGRWVVSGAESGEISVWDVRSGNVTLPRMSASSAITSIAISRDGSLLASGSRAGTIQLWDMRSLSAVEEPMKAHGGGIWCVTFSADGKLLASSSSDCTVRLWELQSGSAVARASVTHENPILCVAFSPEGKLLASGSSDRTVRLWDVPTLLPVGEPLTGHTNEVQSVAFSPEGIILVSASFDQTIRFWDVHTRSAVGGPLNAHDSFISSVAFSPDGRTLASCSKDKTVRLWDIRTRSPLGGPLTGHTAYVNSIAFSPNGSLVASGSSDQTVHVRDFRVLAADQESSVMQIQVQNFAVFSLDGKLLATGSDGHAIQLWDARSVSAVGKPLTGHTRSINSVAFSSDGTFLVSVSDDNTIRLWDVRTRSAVGEPLHSDGVWAVAFSPDGNLMASGCHDGTVRLWDMQSRSPVGEPLKGHSSDVLSLTFSPDGSTLASGSADRTVRLWDARGSLPIGPLEGHSDLVRCVAFSPDGMLLASGSDDKTIRVWSVHTHAPVGKALEGHIHLVTSLAFSPDGALLVSLSRFQNEVRVWDMRVSSEVGALVAILRHESTMNSIAFSLPSPLLLSITSGGVVRKWDLGSLLSIQSANVHDTSEDSPRHSSSLRSDRPNLSGLAHDFLVNLDNGWAVGPNGELILWFPRSLRSSLSDLRVVEHFGGSLTQLDFTRFAYGSDWAKCFSPLPSSSFDL